jgi:hypothetical protein
MQKAINTEDHKKNLEPCPDCQAKVGEHHSAGCDVERCSVCGLNRLQCGCKSEKKIAWDGRWPGESECEEFNFFTRFVPGSGWMPCLKSDEGAVHDLNRLYEETIWSSELGRHVQANPAPEN